MTEQEFLQHHNLLRNPFSDEDASNGCCIPRALHIRDIPPIVEQRAGDAKQPATSIVFGRKARARRSIRLQLKQYIKDHNRNEPQHRVYLVELDDLNSYLGPLQRGLFATHSIHNPDKVLQSFHLWDHMDAIHLRSRNSLVVGLLGTSSQLNSEAASIDPSHLTQLDRGQRRICCCSRRSTICHLPGLMRIESTP